MTRAYDPTTGRFIARDPLGRAPLFLADNPYVYAGNNPLSNIDPSGQYRAAGFGAAAHQTDPNTNQLMARVQAVRGCDAACEAQQRQEWDRYHVGLAKGIANEAANYFWGQAGAGLQPGAWKLAALKPTSTVPALLQLLGYGLSSLLLGGKSGLLATVSSGVLGFFNVLLGVEVMALVSYDVIALATYAFFNDIQASWTNAGWLDPATLSDSWIGYSLFFGLIAGALEIVSALVAITNPEVAPLVIGLQIGMAVAAFRILPRVKSYIDQEEQALGYAQS